MYKVFFDNKKIWVTNNLRKARKKKGKLFSLTTLSVKDFLKKVEKAKSGKFVFYIDKGEDFFSYFTSALICIEAGGGVVRNPKGRILFIKRKNAAQSAHTAPPREKSAHSSPERTASFFPCIV